MTLRAAIISYPMVFQQTGGLPIQMLETMTGLRKNGVDARLFDPLHEKLRDYDLVHVFAAINGNHRVVQEAKNVSRPVVISPVLHPPWTRWDRMVAEIGGRLLGRLTRWRMSTTYQQIRIALQLADHIIALGPGEQALIEHGYDVVPGKTTNVPNGIRETFFAATPDLFRERFGLSGDYALLVAYVSPYKGQLQAARALRGRMPLLLVGPCADVDRPYLAEVLAAGGDQCRWLGEMANADPVLASAYAGARVFVLPSQSEVYPISAIEALATGTPVVLTRENSLALPRGDGCIVEVNAADVADIRAKVDEMLARSPAPAECRRIVEHLSWNRVGGDIKAIYDSVASRVRCGNPDTSLRV